MTTPLTSQTTTLRNLRVVAAGYAGSLLVIYAAMVLKLPVRRADTLWLALPTLLGIAGAVIVPVLGSTVRVLPYGAKEADARRVSLVAMRTLFLARLGVAAAPALFGLMVSFAAHSIVPFTIGEAFTLPLMLLFVYPRASIVDAVRDRLESGGTTSYLWEELTRPTPTKPS